MKRTVAAVLVCLATMLVGSLAWAGGEGECSGGACGTPNTSGGAPCVAGDCAGGGGGGSILVNNTDTGDTYQYADDYDDDGREDDVDNCPFLANKGQADSDGDGVGDACDLCVAVGNKDQQDADGDGKGDPCDDDADNDGLPNLADNCPTVPNPNQGDADKDQKGDACDLDADNDGVPNTGDNCPLVQNPDQGNSDPNTFGDACDHDLDKDNIDDTKDNCPVVANMAQEDGDKDGLGDPCDTDKDNDKILNAVDNCPLLANPEQTDVDRDRMGDACDPRFCFVVSGDETNCLDPSMTFRVYSPSAQIRTGEPARLRLFANRENAAIRYKWIVKERPVGSEATAEHPQGVARVSTPYEYHYIKGNIATFTADQPGIYKVEISGTLVFADNVNPNFPRSSSYVVTLTAEGEAAGGCSVGGGARLDGLALVLLGLLGMAIRRRRR